MVDKTRFKEIIVRHRKTKSLTMDPSPLKLEIATYIDVDLYKAAADSEIEAFNDYKGRLDCLVTPNHNTMLYVHLANQRHRVRVFNFFYFIYYRYRTPTLDPPIFLNILLTSVHHCYYKPMPKVKFHYIFKSEAFIKSWNVWHA